MAEKSLKTLLQTLAYAPEPEKKAMVCSLIRALSEACGLFKKSGDSKSKEAAKRVRKILDGILTKSVEEDSGEDFIEEEWEEEFVESGTYAEEKAETFVASGSQASLQQESETPDSRLAAKIDKWNARAGAWLKLPSVETENVDSVISLILTMSAYYSNITSNAFEEREAILQKFEKNWQQVLGILGELGFEFKPDTMTPTDTFDLPGKIIYTCRPRSTEEEVELVVPGIYRNGELIRDPVWVVALPMDADFPSHHNNADLPSHWRGVFGEIELLLEHLDMHKDAVSAIEGINKNRLDSLEKCRENVIAETRRRSDVLRSTIFKENETTYRLATDYWRVEECFWSVFHDDERPSGCSYLDRLRSRMQSWRTTLRRVLKFHIRDFACGNDSLASVNQYIGNIILQQKKNVSPGTVIRELRPAIVVKDQATSRLLKGRVIAT